MISVNNLTMGFSQRTLFKNVTLSIFPKERIGLTGPNGAGKSTLFSIILGETEPVAGSVTIQKKINIGYLPQESKFKSEQTVIEEVTSGDNRIKNLLKEKRALEDQNKADSNRYGEVLANLEQLGIYELEHKAEKVLTGLGFKEEDLNRPIRELSGGWQMRTLLAKLLTYSYDLLLLDEPSNYLDLEATLWLKDFLGSYPGAFLLISHDRVFLNDVTNYTIILDGIQISKVKGNFGMYEEQKEVDLKSLEKRKKVVDKKRLQLERFTQRFHAQPNRASAVRNKKKMIERLENIELPRELRSITDFQIAQTKPSGYVVAHLNKVSQSYGDKTIYKDLNFEVTKGQKLCLVGPNGSGKSTLLKILADTLDIESGEIKIGHQVQRGYFSQTRMDVLSPNRSAFDEVASAVKGGIPAQQIRNLLALFNYHGDDVFKLVKVLSGGEKSRLILAKLLINPPNFILLDEPTTHLDMDGVKALTKAFKDYDGTLCFISHDLYFIREIADHIVDVEGGGIKVYPGGLNYYLNKKYGRPMDDTSGTKKTSQSGASLDQDMQLGQAKKAKKKESTVAKDLKEKHKEAKKRVTQIKNELKQIDKEAKELETENYVKARVLSESYESRDKERIKEFSLRLTEIQTRLRQIETLKENLLKERNNISRSM